MLNFKVWETYKKADILSVNTDILEKYPDINYSFQIKENWEILELDDQAEELIKFERVSTDKYKCVFDSMAFMKEIENVS
jgi:hypothetical protein